MSNMLCHKRVLLSPPLLCVCFDLLVLESQLTTLSTHLNKKIKPSKSIGIRNATIFYQSVNRNTSLRDRLVPGGSVINNQVLTQKSRFSANSRQRKHVTASSRVIPPSAGSTKGSRQHVVQRGSEPLLVLSWFRHSSKHSDGM